MSLKPTQIVLSTNPAECTDHVTGVQESINNPCNTDTAHLLLLFTPEPDSSWQLPGSMRNCANPLKTRRAQVDPCRCQAAAARTVRKIPRATLCPHRIYGSTAGGAAVQNQMDICRAQAVKELSMTDPSSTYPALQTGLSQTPHLRLGYRTAAGKAGVASDAPLHRPASPQPS